MRKFKNILYWILFFPLVIIQLPILLIIAFVQSFNVKWADKLSKPFGSFNHWLRQKLKQEKMPQRENLAERDPRPEELKALPSIMEFSENAFSDESYVFYYEPAFDPMINAYLTKYYLDISAALQGKNIRFIYHHLLTTATEEDIDFLLSYYFPEIKADEISRAAFHDNVHSLSFFAGLLGIKNIDRPCFIRNVFDPKLKKSVYKVYYLPTTDKNLLAKSVDFYVEVVGHTYGQVYYQLSGRSYVQYSRDLSDEKDIDPDLEFEKEINKLSYGLREEISKELAKSKTKGALRMLLFMLKNMPEYNAPGDPRVKKFMEMLQASEPVKLSPLIVTTSGKLILKDYDKEISLTPVHRAVYIFFLLNEEGIMFKDLPLYKDELFAIYSKLSNRTSLEAMQQTIDELSNPFSNAMSEKCSRIKLAFLKEVDVRVAQHYVIEGSRNTKKRIQLDRSLVSFEGDEFVNIR